MGVSFRIELILAIILILCSPYNITNECSVSSIVSEDIVHVFSFDIAPDDFEAFMINVDSPFTVYGNLSVNAPIEAVVTLKIMNQSWFTSYNETGFEFSIILLNQKTVGNFTFRYLATCPWFLVVENDELSPVNVTLSYALDETAPTIFVDVEEGAIYGGTKTISAVAQEIKSWPADISIWIDSDKKTGSQIGMVMYQWDTTEYIDGIHNITIFTEDSVGNSDRLEIQVIVSNSLPIIIPLFTIIGVLTLFLVVFHKRRGQT